MIIYKLKKNTEVDMYLQSYLQSRLILHEYGKDYNIAPSMNEREEARLSLGLN